MSGWMDGDDSATCSAREASPATNIVAITGSPLCFCSEYYILAGNPRVEVPGTLLGWIWIPDVVVTKPTHAR